MHAYMHVFMYVCVYIPRFGRYVFLSFPQRSETTYSPAFLALSILATTAGISFFVLPSPRTASSKLLSTSCWRSRGATVMMEELKDADTLPSSLAVVVFWTEAVVAMAEPPDGL